MNSGSRTKQRPRRARRKESRPSELLQAALELFVERGFAATRLEDIASRAGVSKGTLYLYFKSKDDLFKAVVRGGLLPAIVKAEGLIGQSAGSTGELLRAVVTGLWSNVGGTLLSGIPKLIIAESGNFPEIAQFYYREVIQRVVAVIAGILKQGIQRGELRRLDVDPTARAMVGPILLMMLWRHSFQGFESAPLAIERYFDSYLTLVLDGLRNPNSPGAVR
ncbi:MAG TPA: TetR/AcrR family transcriptional regulator [Burkholderiales bacterium]